MKIDKKEMRIVNIIGGLGNQMFQYALAVQLQQKLGEVKIDITEFDTYELHNGYELSKLFNIDIGTITHSTKKELLLTKDKESKRKRKLIKWHLKKNPCTIIKHENFDKDFCKDPAYFDGYWQAAKHMKIDSSVDYKKIFEFKPQLSPKNQELLDQFKGKKIVALHIRRGDYLASQNVNRYAHCEKGYYEKAIEYFKEIDKNTVFFFFSNDISWCKETFGTNEENVFIDWNTGMNSYEDLILMTHTDGVVIANSTFSWWGAFLNPNATIIAPKDWWTDPSRASDIYIPENWLRFKNA